MQKLLDVKFIAAALVLAAWFALVLAGKSDAAAFIDALKDILLGLFGYHAVTSLQPTQKDASAQGNSVAQIATAVGTMAAAEVAKDVSAASETAQ